MRQSLEDVRLPPVPRRRRLLTLLLAVSTAVTVVMLMLDPPGGVKRVKRLPADAAPCGAGQTTDCVGGMATVIVPSAPVAPTATAAPVSPAASR